MEDGYCHRITLLKPKEPYILLLQEYSRLGMKGNNII
jgi:hypothetical protein